MSAFLVFYFRSGDISVSWPFILLLLVAVFANEFLKRHFVRLTFQMSLFFLIIFSTAIYLIPIMMHRIGAGIFVLSGFVSLFIIILYLNIILKVCKDKYFESRKMIFLSVSVIYVTVNILYFTNLIPPLPLSLKDSGVFHSLQTDASGPYIGEYEDYGWRAYFHIYEDFHIGVGSSPVYAYSAVFSPPSFDITIVHRWQHYDEEKGRWVDYEKISLPVKGGRDNGFRTFSMKNNLVTGKWRVNVETIRGQIIGRLRFNIVKSVISEPLVARQLD